MGVPHKVHITAALAALWLTACGGGGDGNANFAVAPPPVSGTPSSSPAPSPSPSPAPSPSPSPSPAPAPAVSVNASTQLAANTNYSVTASGPVTLTLPATAAANDKIGISGSSTATWTVAQNAGQSITTTGITGNVAPGTSWSPQLTPRVWHWITSDTTGQVLIAGEAAGGAIDTSIDGGKTWRTGTDASKNPLTGIWITSDMTDATIANPVMYAAQYNGFMYKSTDLGATWTQLTNPLLVNTPTTSGGLTFESITVSADGKHIAVTIQPTTGTDTRTPNGALLISNDSGTTWANATLPAGSPTQNFWRGIDSSTDGSVIVAASHGGLWKSANSGGTWAQLPVTVGGAAVNDTWYRVKVSADGKTIVAVGNTFGGAPGTGIYVSHDGGTTWTRGFALTADYTEIAMSADGTHIDVTVSDTTIGTGPTATTVKGRVLASTDGGATFAPLTMPATATGTDSATDWRAIAMSADGNKLAAAIGNFLTPSTGQLYTSQGNRTSIGTAGSIAGGQGASVTLTYVGNGQWAASSTTGGLTIK